MPDTCCAPGAYEKLSEAVEAAEGARLEAAVEWQAALDANPQVRAAYLAFSHAQYVEREADEEMAHYLTRH